MAKKNQIDLTISKLYILFSAVTAHPYVDENRNAYGFFKKEEADLFIYNAKEKNALQKYERLFIDEPRYYRLEELLSICYTSGALKLYIKTGNEDYEFAILPKHLPRKYYNSELNWTIAMLKTSKKEHWLEGLRECRYIIPAKITENNSNIVYATMKKPNSDDYLYLLFSDMDEYSIWASKIKGWSPLEINYKTLWKIGRKKGYFINVMGNRYAIYGKIAEKIPEPIAIVSSEEIKEE